MSIEHVPLLKTQRDLYELPRGKERFERYLSVMTGGGNDMELPLSRFNPMGRQHVAEALNHLLQIDAESEAERAAAEAARRLPSDTGPSGVRTGLVLADDLGGGWTDRFQMETDHRLDNRGEQKRDWAVALLWTSEVTQLDQIRRRVLESIYRHLYRSRRGAPRTLAEVLDQEGMAGLFADREPVSGADELARNRLVLERNDSSTELPILFACLWGDELAAERGYEPLGVTTRGGFDVAIAEAKRSGDDPVSRL